MNAVDNPFSPGAGTQPPELAGRADVLSDVDVTLRRVRQGSTSRSAIFVGLRGVGKTVLLNRVVEMANENGFLTVFVEAHEDKSLPVLLLPHLRQLLVKLNSFERVSAVARRALMVFKSFASTFKAKITLNDIGIELGLDSEAGSADSGDLEHDLGQLLVAVAEAAKDQNSYVCLLIDELQYLSQQEMSALIMGLHQVSQKNLPLVLYAAGLPLILGLVGRSKSYSERLFAFPKIGVLDELSALRAIEVPTQAKGVSFTPQAAR